MQLLFLRSEECPGLKQWIEEKKYLSGEIINTIIGIMSNQLLQKLLNEVREVALFSLIADEATRTTIASVIRDCLTRVALPHSQCRGKQTTVPLP